MVNLRDGSTYTGFTFTYQADGSDVFQPGVEELEANDGILALESLKFVTDKDKQTPWDYFTGNTEKDQEISGWINLYKNGQLFASIHATGRGLFQNGFVQSELIADSPYDVLRFSREAVFNVISTPRILE